MFTLKTCLDYKSLEPTVRNELVYNLKVQGKSNKQIQELLQIPSTHERRVREYASQHARENNLVFPLKVNQYKDFTPSESVSEPESILQEAFKTINGKPVSRLQLRLSKLLPNGVLNYRIGRFTVDIAWLEYGVVCEYDSWRWHGHRLDQDEQRVAWLVEQGWRVFSIRSNGLLPSHEDLVQIQDWLDKGEQDSFILTLRDWPV